LLPKQVTPQPLPPEKPVLAFDTSVAHCAAALLLRGQVVAEAREEMAKGQAERLMPMIEEMLGRARFGWGDLAGIAVGVGPGNFTGIRISVAAARGLALGLGVPAVGVTALEAVAFCGAGRMRVATPSSRGAVYLQDFDGDTPLSDAREAAPTDSDFWPDQGCALVGDWPEPPDGRAVLRPGAAERVRAIAHIGAVRVAQAAPLPVPFYLRAPDAAPPSDPPPVLLDDLA
jgi:tRNA threonylcarbamoyl adenosine modification protein YeaZ